MGVVIDLAAERRKRRPEPRAVGGILSNTSLNASSGPLTADDLVRTFAQIVSAPAGVVWDASVGCYGQSHPAGSSH